MAAEPRSPRWARRLGVGVVGLDNQYHPQLLGMILNRATGMSVTQDTPSRLWDTLGMESDGAWALDSRHSGSRRWRRG